MATILIPLADGCEELEAVTLIDLLRRADLKVTTAALADREVECAHGTRLIADVSLDQIQNDTFCLLYTSPSPRDRQKSRMPSSA